MPPLDIHGDLFEALHVPLIKHLTLLTIIIIVVLDHHPNGFKDLNHMRATLNLRQCIFHHHPRQLFQKNYQILGILS